MKRKHLMTILTLTLALCSILGLTACGHEHSYTTSVTAPTCTEQGYTTYTCSCGDSYVDDYVDALDHDFKDYIYNNDTKCEVDGTETAICGNGCGTLDIKTKLGTALGHDFNDYISDDNATFEKDGTKTSLCSRYGCIEQNTIIDEGSKLIQIKAYVDGELFATLFTSKKQNYKIELPKKPQDITTNKYIEKYFYGWFIDEYCSLPVEKEQNFKTSSSIYAKWIKTDSTVFNYKVSNGEATITGRKNKTQTLLVIPSFINSFPVRIGNSAFKDDKILRKVIICDGIEIIQGHAFSWCDSLEEIFIPSSIKKIGPYAFSNCYRLFKIHWNAINCGLFNDNIVGDGWQYCSSFLGLPANKTDVIIGEKVEYIDARIFMDGYDRTEFKSFVFENPQGWYRYYINEFGNITECLMIEDINIAFVQQNNYRYGKKEYKFD
ncbi:MAG: leucine-rich repeat protein [Clostridia bacterium]|nr:leucine-rich repeat protein [Clostridia bacterium]